MISKPDIIKYGLIPELVGRLPVVGAYHDLSQSDLTRILTDPKNSIIKQYKKLFAMEGIKLTFTDEAISKIAGLAKEKTRVLRKASDAYHPRKPGRR